MKIVRKRPGSKQVESVRRRLLEWYSTEGRKFPWRCQSATIFDRIITEILLQRTRAETVAKFYPNFKKVHKSWRSIASASVIDLEQLLSPIGLAKQRALRLSKLAKRMAKRNGRFPRDRTAIDELPCVGQYVGNSIELFVWKRPMPLIDVNMARVIERYWGPRELADTRHDPFLQNVASRLVDCDTPAKVNWAVLDLRALVCTSKTPSCHICPLRRGCKKEF